VGPPAATLPGTARRTGNSPAGSGSSTSTVGVAARRMPAGIARPPRARKRGTDMRTGSRSSTGTRRAHPRRRLALPKNHRATPIHLRATRGRLRATRRPRRATRHHLRATRHRLRATRHRFRATRHRLRATPRPHHATRRRLSPRHGRRHRSRHGRAPRSRPGARSRRASTAVIGTDAFSSLALLAAPVRSRLSASLEAGFPSRVYPRAMVNATTKTVEMIKCRPRAIAETAVAP
jgi:hypothetical protein